jgi:hypothetical protein
MQKRNKMLLADYDKQMSLNTKSYDYGKIFHEKKLPLERTYRTQMTHVDQLHRRLQETHAQVAKLKVKLGLIESKREVYTNLIKEENRKRVQLYTDRMKQFQNIGINLTRIAGESDEEYF